MKKVWEEAIRKGSAAEVETLLAGCGEDVSEVLNSKDQHGQTGLMIAAMLGHREVVAVLVQRGAQLNHTAKYHLSALMLAVLNNRHEIVRMLVSAGADRSLVASGPPGFHQKTALDLATSAGSDELAEILRAPANC